MCRKPKNFTITLTKKYHNMNHSILNAIKELRRSEHLLYVSLKYTRTADVIKSVIARLIESFDWILDGLMEKFKDEKKIQEIPFAPRLKCEVIKEQYSDDSKLHDFLDFYLLLRRLNRAEYTESNEFRRHVTMTAHIKGEEDIPVDIDTVSEYLQKTKDFIEFIKPRLENE